MPSIHSNPQKDILTTTLNPTVFYTRFPHISQMIFEILNIKDLENCRKVCKSWLGCIDNQNILWNKVARKEDADKVFKFVCEKGNSKMARYLIQKSDEFKININPKYKLGWTSFHYACWYGHLEIVEALMKKSADFNIGKSNY